MPIIHSEIFWLTVLFCFLVLSVALEAIFIRRTRLPRPLIVLSVLAISGILSVIIGFKLGSFASNKLQAMIAQPYIQKSLNEQCEANTTVVDTEGFFIEAIPYGNTSMSVGNLLRWRFADSLTECTYYTAKSMWECNCSGK